MTKCSDFPRALGTLPAGSAVRVKSRFALYSARGADAVARVRALLGLLVEVFRAPRLAVERLALAAFELLVAFERLEGSEAEERRLVVFAALLLRAADFLPVARLLPDLGPDRLVGMPSTFARSMPSMPFVGLLQEAQLSGRPEPRWRPLPVPGEYGRGRRGRARRPLLGGFGTHGPIW